MLTKISTVGVTIKAVVLALIVAISFTVGIIVGMMSHNDNTFSRYCITAYSQQTSQIVQEHVTCSSQPLPQST